MRPALPPGPYLVVGLARSGLAVAEVLPGEVLLTDSAHVDVPGAFAGTDGVELLDRVATIVKSPGVPRSAPVIAGAQRLGKGVFGELEISWRLLDNPFIAVTGTNGKTTTVELIGAMFCAAEMPVAVAGNVGTPLASLVGSVAPEATIVCECSSFQLEDATEFAPECAVLLNLEPDHLDRHGSFEAYREAKMRLFAHGPAHAFMPGDLLADPFDLGDVRLRGEHNRFNARAAALAADAMGVSRDAIRAALASFAGVPHRLEEVGSAGGVLAVNDSKATNVAAAVRGIEAFSSGVHVILGGSLKGEGFSGLRDALSARARAAYLIGEAEDRLAADLEGACELLRCGTLERAVAEALKAAEPGDVVLLSPACASFDQFRDYEERGERFREAVRDLGGIGPTTPDGSAE